MKNTKAGLLVCDHIYPEYKEVFGDYPDMFAQLFPEFDWVLYDVCNGHFPKDLDECEVYFSTGSRHSVYDKLNWIIKLKGLIRELYAQQKKYIGFCFGHQLLGESLGGKVQKSPNGWCVGVHQFEVKTQQEWMNPASEQLNILMMCQDQIIELPPHTKVLASSEKCPFGMIQVGGNMLGLQGHSEFSKDYNKVLMEKRIDRMGASVVAAGIDSLDLPLQRDLIREWVFNFLG